MAEDSKFNALARELRELVRQLDSLRDRTDTLTERIDDEIERRRAAEAETERTNPGNGDDEPKGKDPLAY